jgi:hypothetical protein
MCPARAHKLGQLQVGDVEHVQVGMNRVERAILGPYPIRRYLLSAVLYKPCEQSEGVDVRKVPPGFLRVCRCLVPSDAMFWGAWEISCGSPAGTSDSAKVADL